jgi:hypothetical protein
MDEPTFSVKRAPFNDSRQERIYRRLLLVGLGPAAFYRDACALMAMDPAPETTTHLVSHALREIESALRDILEPMGVRVERSSRKSQSSGHAAEIRAILAGIAIPETDPVAQAWLRLPGRDNSYGLASRAHRDALAGPRRVDETFLAFWDEIQAILDVVLEKFETRFLDPFRIVDALLATPSPDDKDIERLRTQIPHNLVTLGYFFGKLASPAWLIPLRNGGFFRRPPALTRDDERVISFPPWPEARYLVRMASIAEVQETVLEIALQVPETENVRVLEDLAEIALALPAHLSTRLVPKATMWLESPNPSLLPQQLGDLVSHLAKGGQLDPALDLARSLLVVLPDPRVKEITGKEADVLRPEPRPHFDLWWYEQVLQKNAPDLTTAAGELALVLLCDLLDAAIRLARRTCEGDGPEDHSYIWRRAVDDHQQNNVEDLRNVLVSAVRDTAEQLAKANTSQIPRLIEILEQRPWRVFHRVALHLLRVFPDAAPTLIAERLTDRQQFDDSSVRHEYALLVRDRFAHLSPNEQATILGWIAAGPDLDRIQRMREEVSGQRLTDEELSRAVKYWKRDRLAPFQQALPSEWQQYYAGLVTELGAPEHPEFGVYWRSWVGPIGPVGTEELGAMSVGEIVGFLKEWEPSDDFMGPSRDGLGRALTAVVMSDPHRFAAEAPQFQNLHPTYVRSLLWGLWQAGPQEQAFSWASVLELCRWVIREPRDIPRQPRSAPVEDPEWRETRKAMLSLLPRGFASGREELPFELRRLAWEIVNALTEDPQPTPADEARYIGSNGDPASLAINSVRGEAMRMVICYAFWVRRHLGHTSDGLGEIAHSFEQMPEVKAALDAHLDPSHDPSLAVRAVYGRWFPWLFELDRKWAVSRIPEIFPHAETLQHFHRAAWEAYLTFCDVNEPVFEALSEEYSRAIECIGMDPAPWRHLEEPEHRLAVHLMERYWRGEIELDDAGSLLARFYAKTTGRLAGYALNVVGRWLCHEQAVVSPELIDRLRSLWAKRLEVVRARASSKADAVELVPYGWWFISGRFDDAWAIDQLTAALELAGETTPDHRVVERLSGLASALPRQVLECLRLLVEGDKRGWGIQVWEPHVRTVLTAAIQSADAGSRQAAIDFIPVLAARGHLAFRDLLPTGHSS